MRPHRLTPHFSLAELTASTTAARRGIDNDPPDIVDHPVNKNLLRLAHGLEAIRSILDCPVLVNSGYRSPKLNRLVGGTPKSAHLEGRAADFHAPAFGEPRDVAERLRQAQARLPEGCKVLLEYDRWIHFRIAPARDREFLEANRGQGRTVYSPLRSAG